ncbi:glycosyltransferase family 2 protein [Flavobacterium haoranii]|uniref:Glycosyltransferase involved in cell wall bisynthesis n=1 Tax=Flavobacterium haoranii TaxID=683124 RepID=A0A1M6ET56_9FLAO|nr:glycosyltransferase family 2 protein [Flavobacterium haoranii]SHI88694.1 Glycosyltransferase involved in cell wall bisynthesis [Flavobacterium haoranii]
MKLVSIITPTFNAEQFILQTIQSVLEQTYTHWELILVDDCSSDATWELIHSISDSRIKCFKLDQNFGPGVARNFAIQQAKGNYIAFLDADDVWKPQKLAKQLQFMEDENLPMTFSFYEQIDEEGKSLHKQITAPLEVSYNQLFYCNWIGNLTGIYSVDFFGKIPISSIKKRQDWILWLTLVQKIKTVKPVPESLAFYRVRKDSVSSSKVKLIQYNYAIYRNFHENHPLKAAFNTALFLVHQLLIKPRFTKTI